MSYENTTPIQVGMTGEFAGKRFRVAGRLVMSMDEAGETYYWNEFYLVSDDGEEATLVHEVTEDGVQWRLFRMFEPSMPISLAEAASKRVGDTVNLTGKTLRVTCVDESVVRHIEGAAPEGVEDGDVARYFNAESGNEMIVVSWTGHELECYRGLTFPSHVVSRAFGLQNIPDGALSQLSGETPKKTGCPISLLLSILFIVVVAVFAVPAFRRIIRTRGSPEPKLPKAELQAGRTGVLNGAQYRVTGRATVEVGHVGARQLRHEYAIVNDAGEEALLVQGAAKSGSEWLLLVPFAPARTVAPREMGALSLGALVPLGDTPMRVVDLFLSRVKQAEGPTPFVSGTEFYGLVARGGNEALVARWNETTVTCYRATQLNPRQVASGFGLK